MQRLASLANVKAWLNETADTNDDLLTRLIEQASQFLLNYLQRPSFFKTSVAEMRDGTGGNAIMLRQWPVISVDSLSIGVQPVPAAPALPQYGVGYQLEAWNGYPPGSPQTVSLIGYNFVRALSNVMFEYTAGFFVTGEAHTVPGATTYTVTVDEDLGTWGRDDGVTLANGTALTAVTGTPAAMQYSVAAGVYTFNAAQASAAVLISYSYIPSDIEQACIEIVGERYRYRSRIGQMSVSAQGQITTSYSLKAMQDYTREQLDRYKRWAPL